MLRSSTWRSYPGEGGHIVRTRHNTHHERKVAHTSIEQEARLSSTRLDSVLRWTLLITVILSLLILAYGTVMVYEGQPPIPVQVRTPQGAILATNTTIEAGRTIFQRTDLMDFGSLYGNGAYFGP